MFFSYLFDHNHPSSGNRTSARARAAVFFSLLLSGSLLAGCSGTGTMYTPDSFEDSSEYSDTAATSFEADADYDSSHESESGGFGEAGPDEKSENAAVEIPEEEPRTLRSGLEGTGSDLYAAQAVSSYYNFTLDDVTFTLPCSLTAFYDAGWEIPETNNGPVTVPYYSFEYVDAVHAGGTSGGLFGSRAGQEKIRLCLANFTENSKDAASCTVCGISVSEDSGATLRTTFGPGIGSTIDELTAVFGTDPSIYQLTKYSDGTCTLRYHFANGLTEMETIPVLAEAEDKSIAELLLADTAEDGSTIRTLSMFFFRLPEWTDIPEIPQ